MTQSYINATNTTSLREMAKKREQGIKDQVYLGSSYIYNHTYYNSVKLSTLIPDSKLILEKMTANFNPNGTNAIQMFGFDQL